MRFAYVCITHSEVVCVLFLVSHPYFFLWFDRCSIVVPPLLCRQGELYIKIFQTSNCNLFNCELRRDAYQFGVHPTVYIFIYHKKISVFKCSTWSSWSLNLLDLASALVWHSLRDLLMTVLNNALEFNLINLPWKFIFVLSNGAITVLATAPATAPATKDVMILLWLGTYNVIRIY